MIKNKRLGQSGEANALLLSTILLTVLFIAAAGFAVWAFSGRQDYKNNVDAKVNAAVTANTKTVQATDAAQYAEASKNPLKTYVGPDAYGDVRISYPKTWSAYVDTTNSSMPLNAYFHTDYVPSTNDQSATYNLQAQIVASDYSDELNKYEGQVQSGVATATPYKLPKVPSVTGIRLDGQVFGNAPGESDSLVLIPIRNVTLELSVQSNSYLSDFNNIILPNITFSP